MFARLEGRTIHVGIKFTCHVSTYAHELHFCNNDAIMQQYKMWRLYHQGIDFDRASE